MSIVLCENRDNMLIPGSALFRRFCITEHMTCGDWLVPVCKKGQKSRTGTSQWHGDTADALNCTVSRTVSSLFHSHNEQNHMTFVRHRHINRPSPLLWRFPVWQQDRRASAGESRRRLGWKRTFTSQSPAIQDWPTARPNMTSRVRDLSGRPGRETAHGAVSLIGSSRSTR